LLFISFNKANKFVRFIVKIINNVEIIACKIELYKKPIIDFINQAKGRDQLNWVSGGHLVNRSGFGQALITVLQIK
jgi:hypothetical protein